MVFPTAAACPNVQRKNVARRTACLDRRTVAAVASGEQKTVSRSVLISAMASQMTA
jgi:hypothetical protein